MNTQLLKKIGFILISLGVVVQICFDNFIILLFGILFTIASIYMESTRDRNKDEK